MNTLKKILMIMVLLGSISTFVVGCHTTRGIGEDVQSAGESIQNTTK